MDNTTSGPNYNAPRPQVGTARLAVMINAKPNNCAIAANLSIALVKRGKRACLITTASPSSSIPGVRNQPRITSLDYLPAVPADLAKIFPEGSRGFRTLSAGDSLRNFIHLSGAQQTLLVDVLAQLEAAFDYLIVDIATDMDIGLLQVIKAAPLILLTITPEGDSLTRAFSQLQTLQRRHESQPVHIVVDKAENLLNAHDTYNKFRQVTSKYLQLEPHYLGYIPAQYPLTGWPEQRFDIAGLPSNTPANQHVEAIADRFCETAEMINPLTCLSGHFSGLCSARKLPEMSKESAPEPAVEASEETARSTLNDPQVSGAWRVFDYAALQDAVRYARKLADDEAGQKASS